MGELSFEHVPPKSAYAYNKVDFESIDFVDYNSRKGTWKKISRGRLGAYTLCKKCNNIVGGYAREYKEWVKKGVKILVVFHHQREIKLYELVENALKKEIGEK
jgi:hypothetical protein